MRPERAHRNVVVVLGMAVALLWSVAASSAAQPSIKIQVKKNGPACQAPGDCAIYVKDRGVGVCQTKRQDAGGVYCDDRLEWDLIGKGQLTADHVVLIVWSPQSSPNSEACLDQQNYILTTASPTTEAEVQADPACSGKMTWLYNVVLLYKGKEIARDDPGVLIED